MDKLESLKKDINISTLKDIFKLNIQNPNDLNLFLTGFQTYYTGENYKENVYKETIIRSFLICNEILPFSYVNSGVIDSNILSDEGDLLDEYLSGIISNKKNFLYDYLYRVFYGFKNKYYSSYENMDNIDIEISRILTDVDSDSSEFANFLKDEISNSMSYASEFLYINDDLPAMLTTDRIFIYSALLNYSYSEIMSTTKFKNYLISLLNGGNIPSNWDNIRVIFGEFLKELSKRTINY